MTPTRLLKVGRVEAADYEVRAALLDTRNEVLAGAHYVYYRRI